MTHERIATFFIVMVWHGIKQSWRSRNNYHGHHSMAAVGTDHGRWATDIVWGLRAEREIHRPFMSWNNSSLFDALVA